MSDVLVIWDARSGNTVLQSFVETLSYELARFSLSYRIVALSHSTSLENDQIKPSMRGMLDLVHAETPLHLITFGSKPNALASLISPALRCELHTNVLPNWIESKQQHSAMSKIVRYIHNSDEWGDGMEVKDYFYPQFTSQATSSIVFFEEDALAAEIEEHAKNHDIDYQITPIKSFLPPSEALMDAVGVLVVSSGHAHENDLVELANAYGLPVLLISSEMRNYGIQEGENGWVVSSIQQLQYTNCLKNWQGMSQDTREMISRYCQFAQSAHSGIRCYCSSLGYPERLELKDFKLRG